MSNSDSDIAGMFTDDGTCVLCEHPAIGKFWGSFAEEGADVEAMRGLRRTLTCDGQLSQNLQPGNNLVVNDSLYAIGTGQVVNGVLEVTLYDPNQV